MRFGTVVLLLPATVVIASVGRVKPSGVEASSVSSAVDVSPSTVVDENNGIDADCDTEILFSGPVVELLFGGFTVVIGSGVNTPCMNDSEADTFTSSSVVPGSLVSDIVSKEAEAYVVIGILFGGPVVKLFARGANVVNGTDVNVGVVNIDISSISGVDSSSEKSALLMESALFTLLSVGAKGISFDLECFDFSVIDASVCSLSRLINTDCRI
jgi:hypothetical protein